MCKRETGCGCSKVVIFNCRQSTPWLVCCLFVCVCTDGLQQLLVEFDITLMNIDGKGWHPGYYLYWGPSDGAADSVQPPSPECSGPGPSSSSWAPKWGEPHVREGCSRSSASDWERYETLTMWVLTLHGTAAWKQKHQLSVLWSQKVDYWPNLYSLTVLLHGFLVSLCTMSQVLWWNIDTHHSFAEWWPHIKKVQCLWSCIVGLITVRSDV